MRVLLSFRVSYGRDIKTHIFVSELAVADLWLTTDEDSVVASGVV